MACNTPPDYVGNNYFCQTPAHGAVNRIHTQDPLFAGSKFDFVLPEPTTENLEFRICADQSLADEDALLQFAELYVQ